MTNMAMRRLVAAWVAPVLAVLIFPAPGLNPFLRKCFPTLAVVRGRVQIRNQRRWICVMTYPFHWKKHILV